jgi:hypothetical protein
MEAAGRRENGENLEGNESNENTVGAEGGEGGALPVAAGFRTKIPAKKMSACLYSLFS